jgi:poly-gamma-glutamate capsule biosynthesis protein CapA/YwtB (metallophosphatase superfamily)
MNDDSTHSPPDHEPSRGGLRRDDFFDRPPAAGPPATPPAGPPSGAPAEPPATPPPVTPAEPPADRPPVAPGEPPAAPPPVTPGEPPADRPPVAPGDPRFDEGSTGDLGRDLPRSRRIDEGSLPAGLFGDDPSATEGWEARRMDRYENLPDQSPRAARPRRGRASRRQRKKKIWVRRLVALALLAALVFAVVAIALALTGGDDDSKSGTSGSDNGDGAPGGGATALASASPTASPSPTGTPSVRIVSGGDVMGDRQVQTYAEANGGDAVLRGIAPVLKKGDVAWTNLESPLTTLGSPWVGKDVTFQGTPLLAPALGKAGIDVVTMGNNHALDYGAAALVDTIKRVEKGGVEVVGAGKNDADAWKPAIVETEGGAKVGFLAWTDIIWPGYIATSGPGVASARVNVTRMKNAIRKLAKQVDYVVVGYHWGIEYENYPNATLQVAVAHAAIDAGADLVIGHHPHVLQGFEVYKKRLIAYSLGDLVFDHYDVPTGQTVLVDAVLTPTGVTATLVPVYASTAGIPAVQKGAGAKTILNLVKQYSASMNGTVTIHGDTATIQAGTR